MITRKDRVELLHNLKIAELNVDIIPKKRHMNILQRLYKCNKNINYLDILKDADFFDEMKNHKYLSWHLHDKLSYEEKKFRDANTMEEKNIHLKTSTSNSLNRNFTKIMEEELKDKSIKNKKSVFYDIKEQESSISNQSLNEKAHLKHLRCKEFNYNEVSTKFPVDNPIFDMDLDLNVAPGRIDTYMFRDCDVKGIQSDSASEFERTSRQWRNLYLSMLNTVNHCDQQVNLYAGSGSTNFKDHLITFEDQLLRKNNIIAYCMHCGTCETSLWRRLNGNIVCNACGLYFKMHGVQRPKKLKKTCIKKRKRCIKKNFISNIH